MRPIHKGVRKFGHIPVFHSTRGFVVPKHHVRFWTVPKPHETSLCRSHNHKQTTQHTNSSGNRTKPVGHYMAPRRKITRVGGNLPLIAQFRVFCHLGLLTARCSFLFLFLFPLFFIFLLLFPSFLSLLLSSLSLFLSSVSLFPFSSFSLLLLP